MTSGGIGIAGFAVLLLDEAFDVARDVFSRKPHSGLIVGIVGLVPRDVVGS